MEHTIYVDGEYASGTVEVTMSEKKGISETFEFDDFVDFARNKMEGVRGFAARYPEREGYGGSWREITDAYDFSLTIDGTHIDWSLVHFEDDTGEYSFEELVELLEKAYNVTGAI